MKTMSEILVGDGFRCANLMQEHSGDSDQQVTNEPTAGAET